MKHQVLLAGMLVLAAATVGQAGELALTIKDGRVTLVADNVTVRQILAEWARVGQTQIVNGERVSGPPVSLRLDSVPEREALQTILRNVSGYLAAPREADLANSSGYDRIFILPTSTPPPATSAPPSRPTPRPFTPPVPAPDPDVGDEEEPVEDDQSEDIETPGAPGGPPGQPFDPANPQFMVPRRGRGLAQPVFPGQEPVAGQEPAPGPQVVPGAPTSSARPGEIVLPAAPQTPGAVVPGTSPPQPANPPSPPRQ